MDRVYSSFAIKSADPDTGTIVGLATTPGTDRQGDVVLPKGARYSLPVPLLFSHDHNAPVGAVTSARITSEGIEVIAQLALDASDRVRECWSLIKAGALRGLSIGFKPIEADPLPGGGFTFRVWEWLELSVCAVPANAEATISNIKAFSERPVSALRIHPVKRKEVPMSTVSMRTELAENVTTGAFTGWYARAKAVATLHGGNLAEALEELRAPAEMAARIIKAAAETTTSQPGLAGGRAEVQAFIQQASESSVLMRILADRASAQIPLRTAVYLPTSDMTAAIVGEGQPFPMQAFSLERTKIDTQKIAGGFVVTEDLLRNTSAAGQAFLNHQLRAAVAKAADLMLFARLTESGTLEAESSGSAADFMAAYRAALSAVMNRATDTAYVAFGVKAAAWLSGLEGLPDAANPANGAFMGRPASVTEALDPWRVAVVNARGFAGAADSMEISATNSATVELVDNPTNNTITPTPTNMVSLFQANSAAVKIVMHVAVERIRPDSVAFIDIDLESGS